MRTSVTTSMNGRLMTVTLIAAIVFAGMFAGYAMYGDRGPSPSDATETFLDLREGSWFQYTSSSTSVFGSSSVEQTFRVDAVEGDVYTITLTYVYDGTETDEVTVDMTLDDFLGIPTVYMCMYDLDDPHLIDPVMSDATAETVNGLRNAVLLSGDADYSETMVHLDMVCSTLGIVYSGVQSGGMVTVEVELTGTNMGL